MNDYCEAYTGIVDGKVIIIAGSLNVHDHIGMVWTLLSQGSERHLFSITKAIKEWLDRQKIPRLETTVRHDFKAGHKWAKMLGFINETPEGMERYGTDGKTYDLYARVR